MGERLGDKSVKTYLVSFATTEFRVAQQQLAQSARLTGGIDETVLWSGEAWTQHEFYRRHIEVAGRARGAGYWLWKPFIILEQLKLVADDDVVFYWDCGRQDGHRFRTSVKPLVDWVKSADSGFLPGTYIPEQGPNSKWTKRDCFVYMNCDEPSYWDHCQIQATFSAWRRTEKSMSFLQEWLDCCCDARLVTDDPNTCGLPNREGFIEHRHDQSVLTNLVIKHQIACYGSLFEEIRFGAQKDINFLAARIRNDRLLKTDILLRHFVRYAKLHAKVVLKKKLGSLAK